MCPGVCPWIWYSILPECDLNQDQWSKIMVTDSSVPLMNHDPSDLGSLILIQITPKERTLYPLNRKAFLSPSITWYPRTNIFVYFLTPDYRVLRLRKLSELSARTGPGDWVLVMVACRTGVIFCVVWESEASAKRESRARGRARKVRKKITPVLQAILMGFMCSFLSHV